MHIHLNKYRHFYPNAMSKEKQTSPIDRAISIFRKRGGLLRTRQALDAGIHARTLYALRDTGIIEPLARGLYRLTETPAPGNPDLVTIAKMVDSGVICLLSALSYHNMTTQIPHQVHLALEPGAREPRMAYPPLRTYRFTGKAYSEGIETHTIDGIKVRIYSPEKTLADCFKFRNKIGLDICLEALKLYRERRKVNVKLLLHYASICRVQGIMRPYLEAII